MCFSDTKEFLMQWEDVLNARTQQSVEQFSKIQDISGIILGGSLSTGTAWPLSDIDLILISQRDSVSPVKKKAARLREKLIKKWEDEGWHTGLDVGDLYFTETEVENALKKADWRKLLQKDNWYYCLDKGYKGKPVYNTTGLAGRLSDWFTENRFKPEIIHLRLESEQARIKGISKDLDSAVRNRNVLDCHKFLCYGLNRIIGYLLELWGDRDTSYGRIGTKCERIAAKKSHMDLIEGLYKTVRLDDRSVADRMRLAPDWLRARHEKALLCRQHIGENVTKIQEARDTLRVFSRYTLDTDIDISNPPEWLGVEMDIERLEKNVQTFRGIIERVFVRST